MVHKLIQRRVGDDNGYILVIMAPAMVVLLGLTALVVDLGNGRQKRRQIQSTADAASHAGA
jgi:Flp pilus assembly protein TadG